MQPTQVLRRRAQREADAPARRIPWWWAFAGLIVLALVGRGVVGAALGSGGGTPLAAPVTATATPEVYSITASASADADPAPTADAGGPSAAIPTAAPVSPSTEARVTLHRATATASSTPSTAVPATSAPGVAVRCAVTSGTSLFWGGYNATVTVRNAGSTQVNGWSLTFSIPDGQRIANSWNAHLSVSGSAVRAVDAGYNAVIAPGASAQFGFQVQFTGGPGQGPGSWGGPRGFALNGVACS